MKRTFLLAAVLVAFMLSASLAAAMPPPVWPGTFEGPPHHPYGLVDGSYAGPVGTAGDVAHTPLYILPGSALGPFAPVASRIVAALWLDLAPETWRRF